ncbi:hypothetical protein [Arenicella xantha]|uniref:Uncharacterized protein n=1 Tax=Arenicella xantha TaxID=644221 RepID=A0A395JN49_9GAMM|nr:hypothetical protein [Arenicella xantha]RBP51038.1 hypothetical protein DFR28_102457 [Arenicella xantha]
MNYKKLASKCTGNAVDQRSNLIQLFDWHTTIRTALQLGAALLMLFVINGHAAERERASVDHRVNFESAANEVAVFKTWMIGANGSGVVDAVIKPTSPIGSRYNLKGLDNRKFLQYERQGYFGGINLGWTNNASAKTAADSSYWVFVPKDQSRRVGVKDRGEALRAQPIKYGELIALGRQPKPRSPGASTPNNSWRFLKYSKRKKGINLNWDKKPVYEWAVLGGKPGTTVRAGKDWVILYNVKHKQPMIYYARDNAGHLGWPDSTEYLATTLRTRSEKYTSKKNLRPEVWAAMMLKNQ